VAGVSPANSTRRSRHGNFHSSFSRCYPGRNSRELASVFRESPQKGLQPFAMVLGAETVSGAVVVSLSGLRSALPLVSLSVFPMVLP
jgi:hypothetical protein